VRYLQLVHFSVKQSDFTFERTSASARQICIVLFFASFNIYMFTKHKSKHLQYTLFVFCFDFYKVFVLCFNFYRLKCFNIGAMCFINAEWSQYLVHIFAISANKLNDKQTYLFQQSVKISLPAFYTLFSHSFCTIYSLY